VGNENLEAIAISENVHRFVTMPHFVTKSCKVCTLSIANLKIAVLLTIADKKCQEHASSEAVFVADQSHTCAYSVRNMTRGQPSVRKRREHSPWCT
jgi:hypothetical protein